MTRVLVTGATSPLGIATLRALLADPRVERVLAVGLEPTLAGRAFDDEHRVRYVAVDLAHERNVRSLLFGPALDERMEVVIHAAQHRRFARNAATPRRFDVESTRELLRLGERHKTLRGFVHRGFAEVYRVRPGLPSVIDEDHPLEFEAAMPAWLRDRVETDVTVGTRIGTGSMRVALLRCAEILATGTGSQLYDYLQSQVCLRPLGFDPMVNVLSLDDAARALTLAALGGASGTFNIAGADSLPLSRATALWGRRSVPVPGPLLAPAYALRRWAIGREFVYDMNRWRLHFASVLDGTRARETLGYVPRTRVDWPAPQG